jgi:lipopolysaccharide export system ATP-binding protein
MSEGKIFRAGKPKELVDDEEVRKIYLGERFRL